MAWDATCLNCGVKVCKDCKFESHPPQQPSSDNGAIEATSRSPKYILEDFRLPSGFMTMLLGRMQDVIIGNEMEAKYRDAVVIRSFSEAYATFSQPPFIDEIDRERRIEPLLLGFQSAAMRVVTSAASIVDGEGALDAHGATSLLHLFIRFLHAVTPAIDNSVDMVLDSLVASLFRESQAAHESPGHYKSGVLNALPGMQDTKGDRGTGNLDDLSGIEGLLIFQTEVSPVPPADMPSVDGGENYVGTFHD